MAIHSSSALFKGIFLAKLVLRLRAAFSSLDARGELSPVLIYLTLAEADYVSGWVCRTSAFFCTKQVQETCITD